MARATSRNHCDAANFALSLLDHRVGALLQEKRYLDPERFGGDEVESDNKAGLNSVKKIDPNGSGTAMLAVDN